MMLIDKVMMLLPHIAEHIMLTAFFPSGEVRLNRLEEADFDEIPIVRQVECLCRFIREENGELKLTITGNLPLRVVSEMYRTGIHDRYYERHPEKRIKETDDRFVMIARDLAIVSGIILHRNNALVISRKGEKLFADRQQLLETLIRDFVHRFDLSVYDGYDSLPGMGYRDAGLSLLAFYTVRRQMPGLTPTDMDYAKGFFDIRPEAYEDNSSIHGYLFRAYQNFMELFGLVTTDDHWDREERRSVLTILPTPLSDRMISIADNYERFTVKMNPELKIYMLKTTLIGTDPPVWRSIQVPSSMLLRDLHFIIQYAMGWENAHLHEFEKEDVCYSDVVNEELPSVQYSGMIVADLLKKQGDTMIYRYDFGDNWEHQMVLEELITPQQGSEYRLCSGGARRCPPEDCGGVHGYLDMLECLNDPDDPEREEYLEWLGGSYDPDAWDPATLKLSLSSDQDSDVRS